MADYIKIYEVHKNIPPSVTFHTLEMSDGSTFFSSKFTGLLFTPTFIKISSSGTIKSSLFSSFPIGNQFSRPCEIGSGGTIILSTLDSHSSVSSSRLLVNSRQEGILLNGKEVPYAYVSWRNNGNRAIGFPGGISDSILLLTGGDPYADAAIETVSSYGFQWSHFDDLDGLVAGAAYSNPGDYDIFIFKPNGTSSRYPLRYTNPSFGTIQNIKFIKGTSFLAISWDSRSDPREWGLSLLNIDTGLVKDIPLSYISANLGAVFFDGEVVHIGLHHWDGIGASRLFFPVSNPNSYAINLYDSLLWGNILLFPSSETNDIMWTEGLSDINSIPSLEISKRFMPSTYTYDDAFSPTSLAATWRGNRFFILGSQGRGPCVYSNQPNGGWQIGSVGG